MLEFLKAAFPWIMIGLTVAIFAAGVVSSRRKKSDAEVAEGGDEKDRPNHQSEGMCIGMCLGVALGTTGVIDLATGISLGMLLGLVVGMNLKK